MAKITVTTDEGVLYAQWMDPPIQESALVEIYPIGALGVMYRNSTSYDIADAIKSARRADRRHADTGERLGGGEEPAA